ncbi:MAG: UPF0182 family protein [bacterium]
MFNKKWLYLFFTFTFLVVPAFKAVLNLYPDFLWFQHLGYAKIWTFVFFAKWKVFCGTFLLASAWLWLNALLVSSFSRKVPPLSSLDIKTPFPALNFFIKQFLEKAEKSTLYKQSAKAYSWVLKLSLVAAAFIVALIAQNSWERLYQYLFRSDFALLDPIFSKDIGFYVFSLPFYDVLQLWCFLLWLASFIFVVWQYFTRNVLFSIFSFNVKYRAIRVHLFSLLGCLMLLISWRMYLSFYELLYSSQGVVYGAGYTDLHFLLPVLKITLVLVILLAVVLFITGFVKRMVLPLFLLVVILIFYFVGATLIPSFVQNYIVTPNELVKEKPYILNNIEFTRKAYGVDKVKEESFEADMSLTLANLKTNKTTIDNVRLWNQEPLQQTFSQLQEIRLYYEFYNIDVDRYLINGVPQQVMLSPREMDPNQLPVQAQTWINKHLVYTHGYGLCMSPVNEISKEGLPKFYVKDIPPKSSVNVNVERPELYFGEKTDDYVIVNTKQKEFDYPKGDANVYTRYQGKGGIVLDSFVKRLFFSIKFSDIKILISSLIHDESRIMYDRNIRQIVRNLAPFLVFDQDPYMIVNEAGRMIWVLDAYTLTKRFPYSEPYKGHFNYIRNSVKVTIDAYNGETRFYVADVKDPLIQTYQKMYKQMFLSFSEMPKSVLDHIRYPKDLFTVQAEVYSTYHMKDPQVFYNREDLWVTPQEQYGENQQIMKAYYMVTKLPGEDKESFIQMLPFNPTNKNNMIAWMSVKCDMDDYGRLKVFKFPKDKTIYGPMQIESRIDQDTDISQKLTLWGQMGSRVIRGNLMVVPMETSLVYVEPIYLQATQSKLPELKRVIFAYGDQIVMSETLYGGMEQVFGDGYQPLSSQSSLKKEDDKLQDAGATSLLLKVKQKYRSLRAAAKRLDWPAFGKSMKDLDGLLQDVGK